MKLPCGGQGGGAEGRAQLKPRKSSREPPGGSASSPWTAPEGATGPEEGLQWGGRRGGDAVGSQVFGPHPGQPLLSAPQRLGTRPPPPACMPPQHVCPPLAPTPVGLSDLLQREDGARREGKSYSFSATEMADQTDSIQSHDHLSGAKHGHREGEAGRRQLRPS